MNLSLILFLIGILGFVLYRNNILFSRILLIFSVVVLIAASFRIPLMFFIGIFGLDILAWVVLGASSILIANILRLFDGKQLLTLVECILIIMLSLVVYIVLNTVPIDLGMWLKSLFFIFNGPIPLSVFIDDTVYPISYSDKVNFNISSMNTSNNPSTGDPSNISSSSSSTVAEKLNEVGRVVTQLSNQQLLDQIVLAKKLTINAVNEQDRKLAMYEFGRLRSAYAQRVSYGKAEIVNIPSYVEMKLRDIGIHWNKNTDHELITTTKLPVDPTQRAHKIASMLQDKYDQEIQARTIQSPNAEHVNRKLLLNNLSGVSFGRGNPEDKELIEYLKWCRKQNPEWFNKSPGTTDTLNLIENLRNIK